MESKQRPAAASSKRTVLLVGWTGAKLRHLEKYRERVYKDAGYDVVTFNEHNRYSFWRAFSERELDRNVGLAVDVICERKPFAVHVFSNGGGILWSRLGARLAKCSSARVRAAARGITHHIVDSAPGYVGRVTPRQAICFYHFFRAMFRTRLQRALLLVATPLLVVLWVLRVLWYVLTLQFVGRNNPTEKYFGRWIASFRDTSIRKVLMLYSKADKLIDYRAVEDFADRAEAAGLEVTRQLFDGSVHVAHMRTYPELYKKAILKFLERR